MSSMNLFRSVTVLCFSAAVLFARAQQNDIPLQRDIYIDVERNAANCEARVHSGMKPVLESRADLTNVMGHRVDSTKYYYGVTEKLFRDHLMEVKGEDFRLTADILFDLQYGDDLANHSAYSDTNIYYNNGRGFWVTGNLGSKISFQTMFHETQMIVPQYLFEYVQEIGVIPGQGRTKLSKKRIYDYAWSRGNVSYSPARWLNIQFGQGSHFVGHGYRSVLLSDNANGTPYLEFSLLSTNRRFQYTTWWTKMQGGVFNVDRLPTGQSSESLFYWMRGRFNHFSMDLGRLQVGLFESTLFENIDSTGVKPFDALELNPLIGVNSAVRGFRGREKSLVGIDLRVKITEKGYVYGQFATDDPGTQRFAYQIGARWFDVFRKDLHVQLEYNVAQPFMYMHNPTQLSYAQARLPLAHPLGTSFNEVVAIVDAGFGRFIAQGKLVMGTFDRDPVGANYGGNLGKPDTYSEGVAGPNRNHLFYYDVNVNYLLNHNTNLRILAGMQRRSLDPGPDEVQSTYLYVGIRTSLFNRYYDL